MGKSQDQEGGGTLNSHSHSPHSPALLRGGPLVRLAPPALRSLFSLTIPDTHEHSISTALHYHSKHFPLSPDSGMGQRKGKWERSKLEAPPHRTRAEGSLRVEGEVARTTRQHGTIAPWSVPCNVPTTPERERSHGGVGIPGQRKPNPNQRRVLERRKSEGPVGGPLVDHAPKCVNKNKYKYKL